MTEPAPDKGAWPSVLVLSKFCGKRWPLGPKLSFKGGIVELWNCGREAEEEDSHLDWG